MDNFYFSINKCGYSLETPQQGISNEYPMSIPFHHSFVSIFVLLWCFTDEVLFVLRFYGPVNPIGSCQAWLVYLTTLKAGLVLWAVNKYCAHSYARNWQLPILNQPKGENDCRKYFKINLHKLMLPTQRGSNPQSPDHQLDRNPI